MLKAEQKADEFSQAWTAWLGRELPSDDPDAPPRPAPRDLRETVSALRVVEDAALDVCHRQLATSQKVRAYGTPFWAYPRTAPKSLRSRRNSRFDRLSTKYVHVVAAASPPHPPREGRAQVRPGPADALLRAVPRAGRPGPRGHGETLRRRRDGAGAQA
mmetsp:Transcript_29215/g.90397  ORF Transcript_29215/g.90397 Transcript_29215/m.90397 type:complete len:159 (-) Transcript_29215:200-676(-)